MEIAVVHIILVQIRLVSAETRQCICSAGIDRSAAGIVCSGIIRWRIAYAVAIGEAVIIGAGSLECVIEAQVVPHLVHMYHRVGFAAAEVRRKADDTIQIGSCGRREISIAADITRTAARTDLPHQPDIDIAVRVPAVHVFDRLIVSAHIDIYERGDIAGDAIGRLSIGIALRKAELYLRIHSISRVIVAGIGIGLIEVLYGLDYLSVAYVLRTIIMYNMYYNG